MIVLGIDPGSERSAVVVAEVPAEPEMAAPWGVVPLGWAEMEHDEVTTAIHDGYWPRGILVAGDARDIVVEHIPGLYGNHAGADQLAAVWASGSYEMAWRLSRGRAGRRAIRIAPATAAALVTGVPRSGDSAVRAAILDMYGGLKAAKGTKAAPGPLYGWKGTHPYRALAVIMAAYAPGGAGRS